MPSVTRWTGREAKLLRRALRLTVNGFAERLGVHSRTINKWESRLVEITPTPEMQAVLDTALRRADLEARGRFEELQSSSTGDEPASGGPAEPAAVVGSAAPTRSGLGSIREFIGSDMATSREFLEMSLLTGARLIVPVRRWSASAATAPAVPPGRGGSVPDDLDGMEQIVEGFRGWDASGSGGLRRHAVLAQLSAVAEGLQQGRSAADQQRLLVVAGELSQLAGFMTWDAGLPVAAQRYFLFGLDSCERAGALELGAKIVGDVAQLSKAQGQCEDGLSMVRTALASLPRTANPLVRAELHGHEACTCARLGRDEETAARRAVEASLEAFSRSSATAYRPWNRYVDLAEVESLASATCAQLALRDPSAPRAAAHAERAEEHALRAAANRQQHRLRSQLFDDLRLSKVRLAQDEPEESSALAQRALDRAARSTSSNALERLVVHSRTLTARHGDVAAVAQFRSNLAEHVHRVAPGKAEELA